MRALCVGLLRSIEASPKRVPTITSFCKGVSTTLLKVKVYGIKVSIPSGISR